MTSHSLSFLAGPGVALAGLGVILLLMRWAFAPPPPPQPRPEPADFGLLVPVATVRGGQEADRTTERLRRAGIRCTLTRSGDEVLVLVFRSDAERAGAVVRS